MLKSGLLALFLGIVVVYGGVNFLAYRHFSSPETIEIVVRSGESFSDITETLYDKGAIPHRYVFRWEARVKGTDKRVHAGLYRIERGMSPSDILTVFEEKRFLRVQMTFIEGLTLEDVRQKVEDASFLRGRIQRMPRAVLPETYHIDVLSDRQSLLSRMERDLEKVLREVWKGRAKDLPLRTPHELLVLASIVEKEAGRADERKRVAGVFINRLRRGMRLQSDPTVIYALKKTYHMERPRLTKSDLAVESPYNTYRVKGLPPEPIAMPGKAAMEAVATPAKTDALYFVADGKGGHRFASSLEEHNRNVRLYRQN